MSDDAVVHGDNFVKKNIGFEYSTGPTKHQAVALRFSADFAIFYNCTMDGYQDTLYTHAKRQFFRECSVSSTIAFVFGDAPVVFQNCKFMVRKPLPNQRCGAVHCDCTGKKRQATAISNYHQNSTITAHPDMLAVRKEFKSYLGRPRKFSRTVIMESFIDDLIDPEGWSLEKVQTVEEVWDLRDITALLFFFFCY